MNPNIEDAITDAQELASFLHDVAYVNGLLGDNDHDMAFNDKGSWFGFAQCQALLADKIESISQYYYEPDTDADEEKTTGRKDMTVIRGSGKKGGEA